MITKIVLHNFQIHKHLELELTDGLNCILGHNNSGKSSVIRALYWLFYNAPSGDWMRRVDEEGVLGTTKVKVTFSDGTIIQRIKGDGINQYKLDDETFDNFGFQVPQKIKDALKIVPFKTNKQDFNINVSMQEDKPFLINESAPVKASVIDTLTGTSILQKAISSFNKDSLATTKEITEKQKQIEEDKETLSGLADIEKAQTILDETKLMEIEADQISQDYCDLKAIRNNHVKYTNTLSKIVIPDIKSIDKFKAEWSEIEKLLQNLQTEAVTIKSYKAAIKDIPEIDVSDLITQYETNHGEHEELDTLQTDHKHHSESLKTLNDQIKEDEEWVAEYYKENPACPTCKGKWGQ